MMKKSNRKRQFEAEEKQSTSFNSYSDKFTAKKRNCEFTKHAPDNNFFNPLNDRVFSLDKNESKFEYDPTQENQFINSVEQVNWIYNGHDQLIDNLDYPESTFEQLDLNEQYDFVDKEIYDSILKCKAALNQFDKDTLRRAKSLSNPFESISKCIFQNRSALKMANLDYLCDYIFTSPKPPLINEKKDILYFADLCSGPGGFTEYVFFKRNWEAKGFGLTLKAENDFNLEKLSPTLQLSFDSFYGDLGDGNIFKPVNLVSFRNHVLNNTPDKKGVYIALADGGFSCHGKESQQELLSKRLYLCQFLCALSILRKGGNFLCKLFDIYSLFSVSLIYLMYRCFNKFAIIKPNTSRPANSERYIVFIGKLEYCEFIENFLFKINCSLDSFETIQQETSASTLAVKEDFHQLVPLDIIKEDNEFYNYIRQSNNILGKRQIHFLCKERAFALNPNLTDNQKNSLRKKCLSQWKLPQRIQASSSMNLTPEQKFSNLMNEHNINISKCAFLYYDLNELKQLNIIKYPWNFYFTTLTENRDSGSQRAIYLSFKNMIFFFETSSNEWKPFKQDKLKLPDNTLVYAELTSELKGEGSAQKKVISFHIIDCCILGGLNVSKRPIEERVFMGEKMLKALSIQNTTNFFIRVKKYYPLPMIEDYFSELEMKECKGIRKERLCLPMDEDYFAIVSGLLICSKLKEPFGSNKSNSTDKIYYFNYKSNSESVFKCPSEGIKDFMTNYTERLFWKCGLDLLLISNDDYPHSTSNHLNKITRKSILDYLNKVLKPNKIK